MVIRTALLLGLMFCVAVTSAQTVLPNWVADSLIYETFKGRVCDNVMKAQAVELEKQGKELLHTSKALELSQSESKTLSSLVLNAKEGQQILTMQFNEDRKVLKKKVRKRNFLILGESVVILLLISTL